MDISIHGYPYPRQPWRIDAHHHAKCFETGLSKADILRFFEFSEWPRRHLGFLKSRNFIGYLGAEGRDASAYQISSKSVSRLRTAKILRFFTMAAAAILDCRIRKMLLADGVWRAQGHHCTKFCQNWSFRCGDIAIFRIFKMTVAAILDF